MPENKGADVYQIRAYQQKSAELPPVQNLKSGGGSGTSGGMDDGRLDRIDSRLTALEGEQRTHIRWTVTTALAIGALIVASTGFLMSRIDRTDDRLSRLEATVNELPGKLTSNLNQINQTLLQAVTASKQTPPQVILYPAPAASGGQGGGSSEAPGQAKPGETR